MLRTHTCAELNEKDIGSMVKLCGWVGSRRDHGSVIFIDLRDGYGLTQIVFDPKTHPALHKDSERLRGEFVIRVEGIVEARPAGTNNDKIPTGKIEVRASALEILNKSLTPPFEITDAINVSEEARLKYG
jgi:aspartyl-tRNA synthetase